MLTSHNCTLLYPCTTSAELTTQLNIEIMAIKMAAHIDAAVQCSALQCFVWLFVYMLHMVLTYFGWANNIYSRHDILMIWLLSEQTVTAKFLGSHDIPLDRARCPGFLWITSPAGQRRCRHTVGSRSKAAGPACWRGYRGGHKKRCFPVFLSPMQDPSQTS